MSLIPENLLAEDLIQCEWRVLLSPQCPYLPELIMMTQALLGFSIFCAVFMGIVLLIRYNHQRYHVLAKTRRNPLLIFSPIEVLFISSWIYSLLRIAQSVILLYFQDIVPLFVRGFLFSLSYIIGASAVAYYWIALVAALPQDKIQDTSHILRKMTSVNTFVGFSIILIFMSLPVLEGLSAHYTLTNELLARQLLTTTYSIWGITLFVGTVGIKLFGSKILKLLSSSLKFQKEKMPTRDTPIYRALSKSYASMRPSVLLCSSLFNANVPVVLILAIARYYIWTYRQSSLLFCFALNLIPGFFTLLFYFAVLFVDIKHGRKTGKWIASATLSLQSQTEDVRSGTGKDVTSKSGAEKSKNAERAAAFEMEEPFVSVVVNHKSPDEVMEEFRSSVKR